jgi:hypothetical protein
MPKAQFEAALSVLREITGSDDDPIEEIEIPV